MARVQKTIEQQLAEVQAKRQQLDAREKQLADRQKSFDLRRRAKGEKALLQLALDRIAVAPEFKTALLDQLTASALRPEDREAVMWLLSGSPATMAAPPAKLIPPAA